MKIAYAYTLALVMLLLSLLAQAQYSPTLRCISLDENDDVTLHWSHPADTGADFNHYLVYYSSGTGAFSILSLVTDYNQTSVLVTGSFAGAGKFYIVQVYNGLSDTSLATDTISPIVLGISSQGKRVSLGWNHSGLESQDSVYRVYKQDTGSLWNQIYKLDYPMTAAHDTIGSCSENVAYRVETKGVGGCISRSNTVRKLIKDAEPPRRTNLLSASVDTATGFVDLRWSPSKSDDVLGYMIFYFEAFVRTESSFGSTLLEHTYDDFGVDALAASEKFSVAPFDSCFDSNSMWYNQAADSLRFVTLFIDSNGFERCKGKLSIHWSHPDPEFALGVRNLSGFSVFRQTNGEVPEEVAFLPAGDSVFVDSGLISGNKYTYVVKCIDLINDAEALSNKLVINLRQKRAPDYLYVKSVRNQHETGANRVFILADTTAETVSYGLMRSMPGLDQFMLVKRINEDVTTHFYIDDDAAAAGQSAYQYKVAAFDVCGANIGESQVVQSIHIEGVKNFRDLVNSVSWTDYKGFDEGGNGVLGYDLIRVTNEVDHAWLATYNEPVEYSDDISDLSIVSGDVCYYVQAPENAVNTFGIQDTSVSNLLCFDFPVIAYIPNAFSPDGDGYNDVFEPYLNYVSRTDYTMTIFDRMGRMVFRSTDPSVGWNGAGSPLGTYAYHISMMNVHGEHIEKTGKVHLIR